VKIQIPFDILKIRIGRLLFYLNFLLFYLWIRKFFVRDVRYQEDEHLALEDVLAVGEKLPGDSGDEKQPRPPPRHPPGDDHPNQCGRESAGGEGFCL
jgi:hypothetical protein